jgi:DeoR/GlpR family transcriptional regulator of sugar metabolism
LELPFNVRKKHHPDEKRRIAEIIATLIRDGENIILDASSTAVFAAKALKSKKRLTVITNSIEVMFELKDMADWNVYATGGRFKGDSLSFTGQRAVADLSSFYADKLIFSCKGLDTERGIFDGTEDFAQVKRAMIGASKTKILAVDASKYNKTAFAKIADLKDIDIVVSDIRPSDEWVSVFRESGIKYLYRASL